VTDASGAVLERVYYFDAFGTPTFRSGTGVPLPDTSTGTRFLFTGREWFARLGLYDYRNRTYSPRLGRFVQVDPIGFDAGDVNIYRYVGNDPVNLTDAFGEKIDVDITSRFQSSQSVMAGNTDNRGVKLEASCFCKVDTYFILAKISGEIVMNYNPGSNIASTSDIKKHESIHADTMITVFERWANQKSHYTTKDYADKASCDKDVKLLKDEFAALKNSLNRVGGSHGRGWNQTGREDPFGL
jgi:RHS repeat-associated protein